MTRNQIREKLEQNPVIAACEGKRWAQACASNADILFHLGADIATVQADIALAKRHGKTVFVHMDLTEGIGKDRSGAQWLASLACDGIISTRSPIIKYAREAGLITVQRFFALDTKGLHSIAETIEGTMPDFIEIMPGVIPKVVRRFADLGLPVIAGGLIEEKSEIFDALKSGALAISTGKSELWSE